MKIWQSAVALAIAMLAPTRSLQGEERNGAGGCACKERISFGERFRAARASLERPGTWSVTG